MAASGFRFCLTTEPMALSPRLCPLTLSSYCLCTGVFPPLDGNLEEEHMPSPFLLSSHAPPIFSFCPGFCPLTRHAPCNGGLSVCQKSQWSLFPLCLPASAYGSFLPPLLCCPCAPPPHTKTGLESYGSSVSRRMNGASSQAFSSGASTCNNYSYEQLLFKGMRSLFPISFGGDSVATDNAIMPNEVNYNHCYDSLISGQSCPKTSGKILKDRPIK